MTSKIETLKIQIPRISLQQRDKDIIHLICDQGFVTFDQIQQEFFVNKNSCSKRLSLLKKNGIIQSFFIHDFLKEKTRKAYFPSISLCELNYKTKVYTLDKKMEQIFTNTKPLLKMEMLIHQLMLSRVRLFLKENRGSLGSFKFILSDPQINLLNEHSFARHKNLVPDLSIDGFLFEKFYSLAIELERTEKSLNRYLERFSLYRSSSYFPVFYIYVNESSLAALLKYAGIHRRFGFAHYARLDQVFTSAWGYLTFSEWIRKTISIKGDL